RCSGPYANHIRCTNRSVKAEDIEPEVTKIVAQLVQNERLKQSRWTIGTGPEIASSAALPPPRNDKDIKTIKNRLENNLKKQSKLTDAYLENLLGEDVYRDKISGLRNEEENLKKLLAGYELREIERERSEGYINRVKDFLDGYDDSTEKIDFATKKELAGLLFKNIKIAPAIGGALPSKRISFFLFAPFNFLFSETEKKLQCHPVKIENFPGLSPRNFSVKNSRGKESKTYKNLPKKIYIRTFGWPLVAL
ncbi:hypothetical protein L6279_02450, partial [Candidatus Parcubacteria bacterium]|nr:hypothetical protein [Candidatus Parcubacteria bacterium]